MNRAEVHGWVAPGFEAVRAAFARTVEDEGEDLCAQLAAFHRGIPVVDLWSGAEATEKTLLAIYSATKGVAHLVLAMLVQEGVLDLDAPVASYWPEFGAAGKQGVLLRQLLAHQAGLVGPANGFDIEELSSDRIVADRLAGQLPFWRPGTATGYHALVIGALTGEVVRRATGRTVQQLFRDRLQQPLGLDVFFGLPADVEPRALSALPMVMTPERIAAARAAATSPSSIPGIAFNRSRAGAPEVWELPNMEPVRRLGPASFGGFATARSLAALYSAAAVPTTDRDAVLAPETTAAFGQIQHVGHDLVLRKQKAWAVGFHASSEVYPSLAAGAFGHSGAGGQQAFVDPQQRLSYAFLRRRAGEAPQTDSDNERMVSALVAAARS